MLQILVLLLQLAHPIGKFLHYKTLCLGFETKFYSPLYYIFHTSLNSLDAIVECRGWTQDLLASIGHSYQLSYIHLALQILIVSEWVSENERFVLQLSHSHSHAHTHYKVFLCQHIYTHTSQFDLSEYIYFIIRTHRKHCVLIFSHGDKLNVLILSPYVQSVQKEYSYSHRDK